MREALNTFLLVYAALFPIVNPVGGAPICPGLKQNRAESERHSLARRVARDGFPLLLGSPAPARTCSGFSASRSRSSHRRRTEEGQPGARRI